MTGAVPRHTLLKSLWLKKPPIIAIKNDISFKIQLPKCRVRFPSGGGVEDRGREGLIDYPAARAHQHGPERQ